jgi:hypothetical protein
LVVKDWFVVVNILRCINLSRSFIGTHVYLESLLLGFFMLGLLWSISYCWRKRQWIIFESSNPDTWINKVGTFSYFAVDNHSYSLKSLIFPQRLLIFLNDLWLLVIWQPPKMVNLLQCGRRGKKFGFEYLHVGKDGFFVAWGHWFARNGARSLDILWFK